MLVDVLKDPLFIQEVPGLNLGPGTSYPLLDFRGFLRSVKINRRMVCSTAFQINCHTTEH